MTHDVERQADVPVRDRAGDGISEPPIRPGPDAVQRLQRAAGNAALARWLARSSAPVVAVQRQSLNDYRRRSGLREQIPVMSMLNAVIARRGFGAGVPVHGRGGAAAAITAAQAAITAANNDYNRLERTISTLTTRQNNIQRSPQGPNTPARLESIAAAIAAARASQEAVVSRRRELREQIDVIRGGVAIGTVGSGGSRNAGSPQEVVAAIQVLNGNPAVGPVGRSVRMSMEVSRPVPDGGSEHAEARILAAWEQLLASGDPAFTAAHLRGATVVVAVDQEVCPECQALLRTFAVRHGVRQVVAFTLRSRGAGGQLRTARQSVREVFRENGEFPSRLERTVIHAEPGSGPGPLPGGPPPGAPAGTPPPEPGRPSTAAAEPGAPEAAAPEFASAGSPRTGTPAEPRQATPGRTGPRFDESAVAGLGLAVHAAAANAQESVLGRAAEARMSALRPQIDAIRGANPGMGVLVAVTVSQDTPGHNYRPGLPAPWPAVESVYVAGQGRSAVEVYDQVTSVPSVSAGPHARPRAQVHAIDAVLVVPAARRGRRRVHAVSAGGHPPPHTAVPAS